MRPESLKILVIDDEIGALQSSWHKAFVKEYGNTGFEYAYNDSRKKDGTFSAEIAVNFVRMNLDASLILLDIIFGSHDKLGIEILKKISDLYSFIPVIMLTSVSDPEIRDRCLKLAETYLVKDTFTVDELKREVNRYAIPAKDRVVGSSKCMVDLRRTLTGYGKSSFMPVLITGATGTGKELVARNIHRLSPRRSCPFMALNCAQIADSIEGSELFGHAKGAFTGADKDKVGLLEAVDGGTLFLDEIGTMRLPLQEKLLRVIEDGKVRRIGETKERSVSIRIIAATNSDLTGLVAEGHFSEALFYRLQGLAIHLPDLRERLEDIPELVDYWLSFWHYREYSSDPPFSISDDALKLLKRFSWPGNVRQLVQALGSSIIECYKIANDSVIQVKHLPGYIKEKTKSHTMHSTSESPILPEDEADWAQYRSLWEIRLVCQALSRMAENSKRTVQTLFPNIDSPSETYLRRLAYNQVEGTWGNQNILKVPELQEAFQPLLPAYLKEKEQVSKGRAKSTVNKFARPRRTVLKKLGISVTELEDALSVSDWKNLRELAKKARNILLKESQSDSNIYRFINDFEILEDAAEFLGELS